MPGCRLAQLENTRRHRQHLLRLVKQNKTPTPLGTPNSTSHTRAAVEVRFFFFFFFSSSSVEEAFTFPMPKNTFLDQKNKMIFLSQTESAIR